MAFCDSKEAACQLSQKVLTIIIQGEKGVMPCTLDVPVVRWATTTVRTVTERVTTWSVVSTTTTTIAPPMLKWSDQWAEGNEKSPELHEIEDEALFSIFSAQQPAEENNEAEQTTVPPVAPVEEEGSGDSFVFVPVTTFEASSGTSAEDEMFYDAPTDWPTDLSNLTTVRPADEGNRTDAALPNRKKRAGPGDEIIIGWIGLALGLASMLAALGALVFSRIRAQPSCASRAAPSVQLSRCCSQPSVDNIPMVSLTNSASRSSSRVSGESEVAAVASANPATSPDQPDTQEAETSFSIPTMAPAETIAVLTSDTVRYENETSNQAPVKPLRRQPVRRSATMGTRSQMARRVAQFEQVDLGDDAHL